MLDMSKHTIMSDITSDIPTSQREIKMKNFATIVTTKYPHLSAFERTLRYLLENVLASIRHQQAFRKCQTMILINLHGLDCNKNIIHNNYNSTTKLN